MILRHPIEILYSNVERKIGDPQEIEKNLASENINFDQQIEIPQPMQTDNQNRQPSQIQQSLTASNSSRQEQNNIYNNQRPPNGA